MATELTVIVPTADNDGRTLQPEIDAWETFLLDTVGGYSVLPQQGAWRDPETGKVYRDPGYRYIVTGEHVNAVQARLGEWAARFRQLSLWSDTRRVTVTFVAPSPTEVPAHV